MRLNIQQQTQNRQQHAIKTAPETPGTEAIRAMITLRKCWMQKEEIYLNQGCLHCGSAASYLLYCTSRSIQKLMLDFIQRYSCTRQLAYDYTDIAGFSEDYESFLSELEAQIIRYAFEQAHLPLLQKFESVESVFERPNFQACA